MTTPPDDVLAPFVAAGSVLLLGELHGTHEFPALVARLAGLAVDAGLPVAVVLELPRSEQAALDTFLAGPDDAAARTALTASPFWHPPPEWDDGRSGRGALRLLRALHALHRRGAVTVTLMDLPGLEAGAEVPPDVVALLDRDRDAVMADAAAAALAPVVTPPDGQTAGYGLVLAGNVHTRVVRALRVGPAHLGVHLRRRFPGLTALLGHSSGGASRMMVSARGAETVRLAPHPTPAGSAGLWTSGRDRRRTGHHGWVNVGHLTPSSPLPPAGPA